MTNVLKQDSPSPGMSISGQIADGTDGRYADPDSMKDEWKNKIELMSQYLESRNFIIHVKLTEQNYKHRKYFETIHIAIALYADMILQLLHYLIFQCMSLLIKYKLNKYLDFPK